MERKPLLPPEKHFSEYLRFGQVSRWGLAVSSSVALAERTPPTASHQRVARGSAPVYPNLPVSYTHLRAHET